MTKKQLVEKAEGLGLGEGEDLDRLKMVTLVKIIEKAEAVETAPAKNYVTVDDLIRLKRVEVAVPEED